MLSHSESALLCSAGPLLADVSLHWQQLPESLHLRPREKLLHHFGSSSCLSCIKEPLRCDFAGCSASDWSHCTCAER